MRESVFIESKTFVYSWLMTVLSFYRTNFCMIFIFEIILYECFIFY